VMIVNKVNFDQSNIKKLFLVMHTNQDGEFWRIKSCVK